MPYVIFVRNMRIKVLFCCTPTSSESIYSMTKHSVLNIACKHAIYWVFIVLKYIFLMSYVLCLCKIDKIVFEALIMHSPQSFSLKAICCSNFVRSSSFIDDHSILESYFLTLPVLISIYSVHLSIRLDSHHL